MPEVENIDGNEQSLYNLFLSKKDIYTKSPDNLIAKYNKLISDHLCFSSTSHHGTNYISKYCPIKSKQQFKKYIKKVKFTSNKDRSFVVLWNKMNQTNYNNISQKLKLLVNKENIHLVIKDILEHAILHAIYRKYFINLLKDMVQTGNKDEVQQVISEYVNNFLENRKYIMNSILEDKKSYDIFCNMTKHKQCMMNTNSLILDISKDKSLEKSINILNYKDKLTDSLDEVDDEFHIDLLLNLIIEVFDSYPEIFNNAIMKKNIEKKVDQNISFKNKMLIDKLVNMIDSSS